MSKATQAMCALWVCSGGIGGCVPVSEPCKIEELGPGPSGRILFTTTDFATGAVCLFDVGDRVLHLDVAYTGTDSIPWEHEGLVYLVNRFGSDYIDVRDPEADWSSLGQFDVQIPGVPSANPQGVAIGSNGLAYVALYGAAAVPVFDFALPPQQAKVDNIDLSMFADLDGITEASLIFAIGDDVWLTVQRRDQGQSWARVDDDLLVGVSVTDHGFVDVLTLPGQWPRQWRVGPDGQILILTTGIAAFDAVAREVAWVVDEEKLFDAGLVEPVQVQSFAIAADGESLYIAGYRDSTDFDEVAVWRVFPDQGGVLELAIGDLLSNERAMEIVGHELWIGDLTPGSQGLRGFDLRHDPPRPLLPCALATGLPPYSLAAG